MKIYSMCLVKNEVDILERTLLSALEWSDMIFVTDHSSTDGTRELIERLGRSYPQIVLAEVFDGAFTASTWARPLSQRTIADFPTAPDWWCKLDSDEIYIDNPKTFLAKIPRVYRSVHNASFQYYFTEADLARYLTEPSAYQNGNAVDNLRHFLCNHSERRFIRHGEFSWPERGFWPAGRAAHFIFPYRIRLKHFQYRYPEQIQRRLDIRSQIADRSRFTHERERSRTDWRADLSEFELAGLDERANGSTWHTRVVDSSYLRCDGPSQDYRITEDLLAATPSRRRQALSIVYQGVRNQLR